MIVGVVAADDGHAERIIDQVARAVPTDVLSCSVRHGVAIARWVGPAAVGSAVLEDEHAYVGTVLGDLPGAGTALRGDFALIARTPRGLRLARGRFAGRPLFWLRSGT